MGDRLQRLEEEVFGAEGLYHLAKKEMIDMEVAIGARSYPMAIELRDALDHLALASLHEDDSEQFEHHERELKAHLWRVRSESAEYLAEDALLRVRKLISWGTWWWRKSGLVGHGDAIDVVASYRKASECVALARRDKATREQRFGLFVEARQLCQSEIDKYPHIVARGITKYLSLVFFTVLLTKLATLIASSCWGALVDTAKLIVEKPPSP